MTERMRLALRVRGDSAHTHSSSARCSKKRLSVMSLEAFCNGSSGGGAERLRARRGSMVTQLAREAGAYVIGTGRAADRQKALDFGAQEFVDLENDALEDVGRAFLDRRAGRTVCVRSAADGQA
jgi:hypothetical protein